MKRPLFVTTKSCPSVQKCWKINKLFFTKIDIKILFWWVKMFYWILLKPQMNFESNLMLHFDVRNVYISVRKIRSQATWMAYWRSWVWLKRMFIKTIYDTEYLILGPKKKMKEKKTILYYFFFQNCNYFYHIKKKMYSEQASSGKIKMLDNNIILTFSLPFSLSSWG